ncbi:hypothetical protein VTN77DRAFT_7125 [Rasamsonia byssochlamydoides]|uniref:uncharacterized protein n=1 Tax=Rasamsonia byssochlamydoides TaxID=89139 RepID=UPI003743413D
MALNSPARADTTAAPTPAEISPFLSLPAELRLVIYDFLFGSTRLTFGKRLADNSIHMHRKKPRRHSLAILYACRLIYQEAGDLWLGRVLFNFDDPCTLLDKLTPLPKSTVSQIRHLRIWAESLFIQTPEADGNDLHPGHFGSIVIYGPVAILKLLPALRLDTLTVFSSLNDRTTWHVITRLVAKGNGWRRLNFIAPDSMAIMWSLVHGEYGYETRVGLPTNWEEDLFRRDGANSGASVTVYRAKVAYPTPDTVHRTPPILCPETRLILDENDILYRNTVNEANPPSSSRPQPRAVRMSDREWEREMLVVVKRGRDADIAEPEEPLPYEGYEDDIRWWSGDLDWPSIRPLAQPRYVGGRLEPFDGTEADHYDNVVEDVYHNVEEYDWPPPGGHAHWTT